MTGERPPHPAPEATPPAKRPGGGGSVVQTTREAQAATEAHEQKLRDEADALDARERAALGFLASPLREIRESAPPPLEQRHWRRLMDRMWRELGREAPATPEVLEALKLDVREARRRAPNLRRLLLWVAGAGALIWAVLAVIG